MITTRRPATASKLNLQDIPNDESEQVLLDVDAAYMGEPGRVSLTTRRLLFRPLEHSDTVKLYNKLRAVIVPTLSAIEHVAVTNFEAAQSVVLTLSDVGPLLCKLRRTLVACPTTHVFTRSQGSAVT